MRPVTQNRMNPTLKIIPDDIYQRNPGVCAKFFSRPLFV